jgi:hypothetical protein
VKAGKSEGLKNQETDQPTNSGKERSEESSETALERQEKVTSKTGLKGKGEWNSPANQRRGGEPATRRTEVKEGAE